MVNLHITDIFWPIIDRRRENITFTEPFLDEL